MAPALLLVKSRSRDGSVGFWSLSLSELSLELSWRGGMVVVSWRPAACFWPRRLAGGSRRLFVPGVLCAGAATSQEMRAAAPSVASCVAAQNWSRRAAKRKNGTSTHPARSAEARPLATARREGPPARADSPANILGGSRLLCALRAAAAAKLPVACTPACARACIETRRARLALPRRRHAASLATELGSHLLPGCPRRRRSAPAVERIRAPHAGDAPMDFKVDDDVKAPSAHQLAPSRKAGRQDWELQPTDGFSTPAELYLKAVPDDSSSDGGDGEDTYAALQIGDELPHFKAASTNEKAPVDSREYGENQWLVIVTFCRTYDPVATSELTQSSRITKGLWGKKDQNPGTRREHEDHDREVGLGDRGIE